MTHNRPTSLAAALVCAGVLALAGCSSSGGAGSSVDLATVPLRAGDLPSSWTAKAHDTSRDASNNATSKQVASCIGAKDTSGDRVKQVFSKDYSMGNSTITSDASEYKSSVDVDSGVKVLANPKTKACVKKLFTQELSKALPTGATIAKSVFTVTPGSNGGPSNVVATLTGVVTIAVKGQTLDVYSTTVDIRGQKITASIDFTSQGQAIDPATITKAVAAVAKRAKG